MMASGDRSRCRKPPSVFVLWGMAMILSALALCALALSTQEPRNVTAQQRLRIDLVFHSRSQSSRFERTTMAEVAEIWARYGVDVRAASSSEAVREGAIRLDVVSADHIRQQNELYTLGTILFVEGEPSTRIVMYPEAIETLVAAETLVETPAARSSPLFHEEVLARAFGRALAHEIGHFLLRSKGHSRTGLMRASPLVSDLIGVPRNAFVLSPDEVRQLHALPAWPCPGERSAGGGLLP